MFLEQTQTLTQQVYILNWLMANSFQTDQYHSKLNERDYQAYVKNMPSLPTFNTNISPTEHARSVCKTLANINPLYHRSKYFVFWLHNTLVNRPFFYIDRIDDSVFGGEPNNPRLVQPRNHNVTKLDESFDERQALYTSGFDKEVNSAEMLEGVKIILRELYGILAKDRVMSVVTGKWSTVKIINDTTLEIEIHTLGVTMQHGIQQAIRDYFINKWPKTVETYHFGAEIIQENLEKLVQEIANEQ